MRVLIIEDDRDIASLMKEELELYRIRVKIVNSGVDAYKILYRTLPRNQFDYIIIDLGLPDENGVEIIKCVKQKFTSKIIVYTGKDYEDYKDKCQYDHYLQKGIKTIFDVVDIILNENLV